MVKKGENTPEKQAFIDARRCKVIKGANGKYCEIDTDETGQFYVVREFEPVVMAEVNQSTGAILALTRLKFSEAFHRQGVTEIHKCHDGCYEVNLTAELEKPAFADIETTDIVDNYRYDSATQTLVEL